MAKVWIEFTDKFGHSTAMFDIGCIDADDCQSVNDLSKKIKDTINFNAGEVSKNWAEALVKERNGDGH